MIMLASHVLRLTDFIVSISACTLFEK